MHLWNEVLRRFWSVQWVELTLCEMLFALFRVPLRRSGRRPRLSWSNLYDVSPSIHDSLFSTWAGF